MFKKIKLCIVNYMIYKHIINNSKNLLVFINDMVLTGTDNENFSCYKILNENFNNYDILFIKDIKQKHWYITIIEDIYDLIYNLNNKFKYTNIFGLTSSSGAICALNVLYKFSNFKKAVIINGQTCLNDKIIDKYKNNCQDCSIFNKDIISNNEFYERLYDPLKKLQFDDLKKFIFYFNNSVSDQIYFEYTKSFYGNLIKSNICYDKNNKSHGEYVSDLFSSYNFMNKIKFYFNNNFKNNFNNKQENNNKKNIIINNTIEIDKNFNKNIIIKNEIKYK